MTAPRTLPGCVSEEVDLLLRASETLDSMWHARYHGGMSSGRQGHERWVSLKSISDDIAAWRRRNGFDPTTARIADARWRRLAGAKP